MLCNVQIIVRNASSIVQIVRIFLLNTISMPKKAQTHPIDSTNTFMHASFTAPRRNSFSQKEILRHIRLCRSHSLARHRWHRCFSNCNFHMAEDLKSRLETQFCAVQMQRRSAARAAQHSMPEANIPSACGADRFSMRQVNSTDALHYTQNLFTDPEESFAAPIDINF